MRILMVEDDRRLASQIQKGLEEQRHTVTLAFDGREGLAAARHGQFDVVVLDVMLPGMDGFSIVKQVMIGPRVPSVDAAARSRPSTMFVHWSAP